MTALRRRQVLAALGSTAFAGCGLPHADPESVEWNAGPGRADVSIRADEPPAGSWPMRKRDPGGTAVAPAADAPESLPLTERWVRTTGQKQTVTPVVADGTVLALTESDRTLAAIDPDDGTVRWSASRDRFGGATPVVVDGIGVVPWGLGDDGEPLAAVGLADGERRWRTELSESLSAGLVRAGDAVLAGRGHDATLRSFDAASGEPGPRLTLSRPSREVTAIAVGGDTVYLSTLGMVSDAPDVGHVVAFDPGAVEVRWTHQTDVPVRDLMVVDGAVYATGIELGVALSASSGEVIRERSESDWGWTWPIAATADTVYVDTGSAVRALTADDWSELWRREVDVAALLRAGDTIVAAGRLPGESTTFGITALAANDGSVQWQHAMSASPSAMSIADGRLFVGTDGGDLHCFA